MSQPRRRTFDESAPQDLDHHYNVTQLVSKHMTMTSAISRQQWMTDAHRFACYDVEKKRQLKLFKTINIERINKIKQV